MRQVTALRHRYPLGPAELGYLALPDGRRLSHVRVNILRETTRGEWEAWIQARMDAEYCRFAQGWADFHGDRVMFAEIEIEA